ncbi:MAG: LysR family transcriptional regulator [Bauldia sp.]|nr:LysR family transcriptional regulator [Bauldia sp.]
MSFEDRAMEWNDLSLILAIGRHGSLSGAARAVGQTHSTVFRRINAIEKKTGVRFFDRFRHGYVMTDAGQTALEYAERVETEFHALGREVLGRDETLRGRIRVTCPEAFAEEDAPPIIARFCERHPEIRIDLSPGHGALDLNRREAEIAIRVTRAPPPSAYGRKICDFRFAFFAAPAYMARHPGRAFSEQTFCLIDGTSDWLVPMLWKTKDAAEQSTALQCRSSRAVQNAAAEGLGATLLPCYVGDADDRLVRISDTFAPLDMEFWVLTHPDLRRTARVRAFMTHVYEELAYKIDLYAGLTRKPGRWLLELPPLPASGGRPS